MVRTHHLPPPAKTPRQLRNLAPAGRFLSVPWCVTLSRCGPSCCAVHGRIADGRPCGWAGRCARLRRSACAVTTVGVRTYDGQSAPSAVSRATTDGPQQRQIPAGPALLGRTRGRFDYHSGGTWLRRRSSCLRRSGQIRRQARRQVRGLPSTTQDRPGLGCGDWLAAFAWVPSVTLCRAENPVQGLTCCFTLGARADPSRLPLHGSGVRLARAPGS
jgi:hypothetical protein